MDPCKEQIECHDQCIRHSYVAEGHTKMMQDQFHCHESCLMKMKCKHHQEFLESVRFSKVDEVVEVTDKTLKAMANKWQELSSCSKGKINNETVCMFNNVCVCVCVCVHVCVCALQNLITSGPWLCDNAVRHITQVTSSACRLFICCAHVVKHAHTCQWET